MRLLTDPQPAIEWFCTGASVCIGVERLDEQDAEIARDARVRPAMAPKATESFALALVKG